MKTKKKIMNKIYIITWKSNAARKKSENNLTFNVCRMPISYVILSLMESGDLTKLQNKWWHDQAKCLPNKKPHELYNDGLMLNNLAGVFFILIVGLILSLFVAIIEFCFKQHDPIKQQHQKFKTKPAQTTSALNTLQGKSKLTIQEQRDFDNGRVTVSRPNDVFYL